MDESEEQATVGFATGLEIARRRGVQLALAPTEAYLLEPIAERDRLFRSWNAFLELKAALLEDPNCFDEIGQKKEINRTGATRLATAFGLSLETIRVDEAQLDKDDRRFQVRVRASKGARYADGVGSCRISEIEATTKSGGIVPLSQREHFALTRAATRATKRAIADIVGGTEAE